MAGRKRPSTSENPLSRTKHPRLIVQSNSRPPDGNRNITVDAQRISSRRNSALPLFQNLDYEAFSWLLHSLPLSTDIDLHPDVSISDARQTNKLKRALDHGWCRVCLHPNPITYINFPCGHMVHCENCERCMRKCCQCQGHIEYTVYWPEYNGCFPFSERFGFRSS